MFLQKYGNPTGIENLPAFIFMQWGEILKGIKFCPSQCKDADTDVDAFQQCLGTGGESGSGSQHIVDQQQVLACQPESFRSGSKQGFCIYPTLINGFMRLCLVVVYAGDDMRVHRNIGPCRYALRQLFALVITALAQTLGM